MRWAMLDGGGQKLFNLPCIERDCLSMIIGQCPDVPAAQILEGMTSSTSPVALNPLYILEWLRA
jgi:hypothetical protein